jgi:TonB family protein
MQNTVLGVITLFLAILFTTCGTSRFRSPKVIEERELEYPLSAMLDKVEGNVVVGVFVSPDGRPLEVRLLESSTNDDLDRAALKFANDVNFEPALLDEQPVGAWTKLIMRYKLSEVYFEQDKWLNDVRFFIERASVEKDSIKRESILRSLYSKYHGLVNYVNRHPELLDINYTINRVILNKVENRYGKIAKITPIQFAVFDDFLERFPDSSIKLQAKEDLLLQLVETEYRIRIKGLRSNSYARKTLETIDFIEARIKELQNADEAK